MDDDQIPVTPPDDVDDVDLYEDLDLFCSTRAVTECSLSYTELQEKLREKEIQLNALKFEVKQLAEQNVCLKKNISCLFRTAKNELQYKDKQINLLHTRLIKKPGKKARKKKTPNVSNASVVKASDQSHNSTVSKTQTITTNSITDSSITEISTPVTICSTVTQCNKSISCNKATSNSKEVVTPTTDTISGRMSTDIPLSVISQEMIIGQGVDDKSTRVIASVTDTVSGRMSADIPLSVIGQEMTISQGVDDKSTRMITSVNETVNDAVRENGETETVSNALSNGVSLVKENDEAVNTTNSSGEDNDAMASAPAEALVEDETVHNDVDCVADGETLSISDGEILSESEEGNPPMTGSCDGHSDAIVSCDDKVLSHQPASRSSPHSGQSRNHHDQCGHHSGRRSEKITSRLHNRPDESNPKSNTTSRHSQPHGHNEPRKSSSCAHGSHDSSRLHHTSSGSHDSSRLHHASSGSHDSSKRLHHNSSGSHDSSRIYHTSSSRSHDSSKGLHHNSSGLHDSKSHHISGGSHDSSRTYHMSSRSHGSSEKLHRRLSGSHDSLKRLHHSPGELHDSHNSSRRHHSSSGPQNSSRTCSLQCSQHNSILDQSRTNEHGSGATRGSKRRYSNHGSSRDAPTKRKRST